MSGRQEYREFRPVELYVQYKDYNWMMSFTEKLLERTSLKTAKKT